VLLCGLGADHYMDFPPIFVTDALAHGKVTEGLKDLWHWSVSYRQSFWKYLERYAIRPFLPRTLRSHPARPLLPWIERRFDQRYEVTARNSATRHLHAKPGRQVQAYLEYQLSALQSGGLAREISGEGLDVRFPFLDKSLVEFALSLPMQLLMQPNRPKWVLREALSEVLPESIRNRTGKGTIGARVRWSLQRERATVDYLTRNMILSELGCIDEKRLRRTIRNVQRGRRAPLLWLHALALEMWLRVRAGRWSPIQTEPR